jgi:hypothetical protein
LEAVNAADKDQTANLVKLAKATLPYTASVTPNVDGSLLQTYLNSFLSNNGV